MVTTDRDALREHLTRVAADLLARGGPSAVTTRGVAQAGGVQAPTIYRLFGDKDGLLEAVAEWTMAVQVGEKATEAESAASEGADPLADFREAWRRQVDFGLSHPALFHLLSDPARVRRSAAARAGREVLARRLARLAAAGLLRVREERAADLVMAGAIGVIQTQLSREEADRDPGLGDAMLETVEAQILHVRSEQDADPVTTAAVVLRSAAPDLGVLTPAEQQLLRDWLDRVTDEPPRRSGGR